MKRTVQIAVGILAASTVLYWLPDDNAARGYWPVLALLGLAALAGVGGAWHRRRASSAGTVQQWSARSRRRHGVASVLDIARVASSVAVRRKGPIVRPSLPVMHWRTPTTEVAVELCRVGALKIWSPLEINIAVFGAPRKGKTRWFAGAIIDAPGAVVSTSTRLDLWKLTSPSRGSDGRPVYVFNPGGLGKGFESTITFNPLYGCETPMIAMDRAADMIPDAGGGEGERWDKRARRNLAVLLHAAAISGKSCAKVAEWVADINGSDGEILSALRRSPEPSFLTAAKQLINLNERTQTSITDAIMPAFSWLIDPNAVAAATGECQLDIETLLAQRGTVYLLGREEGHTAPLLAALTGYIARTARRLAEEQGGRLDPPLTLALDEASRVAPVPLPDWSGDFGGAGICIIAAFQSRADMISRWGEHDAGRILTNCGSVLVFGGGNDNTEHEAWSKRTGERDEPTKTPERFGKPDRAVRKAPVVSPTQIASLPFRRVVVFCDGMPPAIGTVKVVGTRADVRRAARADRVDTQPVPCGCTAGRGARTCTPTARRARRRHRQRTQSTRRLTTREGAPDG